MKKRKKQPNDYPVLTFRPTPQILARIRALKARSGMSAGQIVSMCIAAQLPVIEAKHA